MSDKFVTVVFEIGDAAAWKSFYADHLLPIAFIDDGSPLRINALAAGNLVPED